MNLCTRRCLFWKRRDPGLLRRDSSSIIRSWGTLSFFPRSSKGTARRGQSELLLPNPQGTSGHCLEATCHSIICSVRAWLPRLTLAGPGNPCVLDSFPPGGAPSTELKEVCIMLCCGEHRFRSSLAVCTYVMNLSCRFLPTEVKVVRKGQLLKTF